jgi:hypothetical protein
VERASARICVGIELEYLLTVMGAWDQCAMRQIHPVRIEVKVTTERFLKDEPNASRESGEPGTM